MRYSCATFLEKVAQKSRAVMLKRCSSGENPKKIQDSQWDPAAQTVEVF